MKIYRTDSEDKTKKKLGRKGIVAICTSAAAVVAAVAITLAIALSGGGTELPASNDPPVNTAPAYVVPVEYTSLGRGFSNEKLVNFKTMGFWETHEALDFLVEANASVKAIAAGTVISVDTNTSLNGSVITIQHGDIIAVYKGLTADISLAEGDTVTAGQIIGTVGSMVFERDDYESAHLHLEIIKDGKYVNPLTYLTDVGNK